MEVSNVNCRAYYQTSRNLTLEVETTATVDFNDGEGAKPMYCNFDYVPTEWPDDAVITDHEGKPQSTLIKWLECLCSEASDWQALDDLYLDF